METIDIEKEYQELIDYLSCLGNVKPYPDYMSRTLRVFDNSMNDELKVEISIPMINGKYDTTQVLIRWKDPSYTNTLRTLKFKSSMNQKVMFDILLFDITNWKLNYLNDKLCIARNVEKK